MQNYWRRFDVCFITTVQFYSCVDFLLIFCRLEHPEGKIQKVLSSGEVDFFACDVCGIALREAHNAHNRKKSLYIWKKFITL